MRGASFIDRILPMPDPTGGLRSDVWGGPNVKPRNVENGIEHPDWSFWCRGVRRMDDGKYHLFGARWPEDKGFDYWPQSRVYHAVSDHPCGPFKVVDEDIAHGHNVTSSVPTTRTTLPTAITARGLPSRSSSISAEAPAPTTATTRMPNGRTAVC